MNRLFFIGLLVTLFLTGCTERIVINIDDATPRLVINGFISTKPGRYTITVSRSQGYFDNSPILYYDNADVFINDMPLRPDSLSPGNYHTPNDFRAIPLESYTLKVWLDFDQDGIKELYTATTTVPAFIPMLMLRLVPSGANLSKPGSQFPLMSMIVFSDLPGANFYGSHFRISTCQDSLGVYKRHNITKDLSKYFLNLFGPEIADQQAISFPTHFIGKRHIVGYQDTIRLYPKDTIFITLDHHAQDYFEYLDAAKSAITGQTPLFSKPVGMIPSNISGGAIGCFGSYTTSERYEVLKYDSLTWKEEEMIKRFGVNWREVVR